MTRYEIHIDELVLHGVPPELARDLGPLVEARLAELAGGADPEGPAHPARTPADLAGHIAQTVWQRIDAGVPK
jgi:hypothetical protein